MYTQYTVVTKMQGSWPGGVLYHPITMTEHTGIGCMMDTCTAIE